MLLHCLCNYGNNKFSAVQDVLSIVFLRDENGSIYLQTLAELLKYEYINLSLERILTLVRRRMVVEMQVCYFFYLWKHLWWKLSSVYSLSSQRNSPFTDMFLSGETMSRGEEQPYTRCGLLWISQEKIGDQKTGKFVSNYWLGPGWGGGPWFTC